MRRLIRWMLVLFVAIGAWLALVFSEWLPRPTAEEQAALAALAVEPDSAKGERNGFAAMWFVGYEVPEDQLGAMLKADVAAYDKLLAETGSAGNFRSTAEGRFPKVAPYIPKDPALCELWIDDCLERVRNAPDATRQRLGDLSMRLRRSRELARHDHFHSAFSPRFDSPIPMIGGLSNLQLSEAALQYVDGNVDQAFATLCSDTALWRRMRSRSDMLIADMIGVAQMSTAAQLYGRMLAQQPAGFAAPCPEVFAPLADAELDQCATMRFEFLAVQNALRADQELMAVEGTFAKVVHQFANNQHLVRRFATGIGPYCQADQRKRTEARDPTPPEVDPDCDWSQWAVDPAGCSVMKAATPSYHVYHVRVIDLDARLRLLNTAIWLRSRPGTDIAASFAARPPQFDSPQHEFTWVADRSALRLRNLERNRSEFWEVAASMPAAVAVPRDAPQ